MSKKRINLSAYLYILPALVIFSLFIYWPAIYSFILSFFNTTNAKGYVFIGFGNYSYLFSGGKLPYSFLTGLEYSVMYFSFALVMTSTVFLWVKLKGKVFKNFWFSIVFPLLAIIFVYPSVNSMNSVAYEVIFWIALSAITFFEIKKYSLFSEKKILFLLLIGGFYVTIRLVFPNQYGLYNLFYVVAQNNPFVMSIWNTIYFVIIDVPVTLGISLTAALLMKNLKLFQSFFRTAYFTPYVTSIVAISLVWMWLYNYHYGIINYILSWFGIPAVNWLNNASLTMPTVAILTIWQFFGYYGLIFLSGLQNIDDEYYEAAEIEGANSFQKFIYITWPLLRPITFFVVVVSFIGAFQVFTQVYVLYHQMPGPYANSGLTMVFYIYNTFYNNQQMGLASAAAYVLLGIIMILTLVQFKFSKKDVEVV